MPKRRMTQVEVLALKAAIAEQMTLPSQPPEPIGYKTEIDDTEFLAMSQRYKLYRKEVE
jgi:hypothetical protein